MYIALLMFCIGNNSCQQYTCHQQSPQRIYSVSAQRVRDSQVLIWYRGWNGNQNGWSRSPSWDRLPGAEWGKSPPFFSAFLLRQIILRLHHVFSALCAYKRLCWHWWWRKPHHFVFRYINIIFPVVV